MIPRGYCRCDKGFNTISQNIATWECYKSIICKSVIVREYTIGLPV